jgi:hypothetical protein
MQSVLGENRVVACNATDEHGNGAFGTFNVW